MEKSVENFYSKNPEENYIDNYDVQHGDRLDKMIDKFNLKEIKNSIVLDVGGGLGFLGKRLKLDREGYNNEYLVIDGANLPDEKQLCKGQWEQFDLDKDNFGDCFGKHNVHYGFLLETIEHLSNPYHCLVEMKKLVKEDAEIIISYPDETVWHNVIYCGLFWPRQNFEQFLGQMALEIKEFYHYRPEKGKGWPAYTYRCINRNWMHSKMAFPKSEIKFFGKTPLEYTNL